MDELHFKQINFAIKYVSKKVLNICHKSKISSSVPFLDLLFTYNSPRRSQKLVPVEQFDRKGGVVNQYGHGC